MLKEGKLEIPSNSDIFIKCKICGCDIRYGELCNKCKNTPDTKIKLTDKQGAMRYIRKNKK